MLGHCSSASQLGDYCRKGRNADKKLSKFNKMFKLTHWAINLSSGDKLSPMLPRRVYEVNISNNEYKSLPLPLIQCNNQFHPREIRDGPAATGSDSKPLRTNGCVASRCRLPRRHQVQDRWIGWWWNPGHGLREGPVTKGMVLPSYWGLLMELLFLLLVNMSQPMVIHVSNGGD